MKVLLFWEEQTNYPRGDGFIEYGNLRQNKHLTRRLFITL